MSGSNMKRRVRGALGKVGVDVRRARPGGAPDPTPTPAPAVETLPGDTYRVADSCQIPYLSFLYERYLGARDDGCFVEVGAYDGYSYSNTWGLAEAGWRGFYVEPVPASAAACRARHASNVRVRVDEVAIGADAGEVEIFVGGELSTARPDTRDEFRDLDWARDNFAQPDDAASVVVPRLSLDAYLADRDIATDFDVLVVDVEGYEAEVFAGFDLQRWRPTMMIVELADAIPHHEAARTEHAFILRSITAAGYVIAYKDRINTMFVTAECYDRAQGLAEVTAAEPGSADEPVHGETAHEGVADDQQ